MSAPQKEPPKGPCWAFHEKDKAWHLLDFAMLGSCCVTPDCKFCAKAPCWARAVAAREELPGKMRPRLELMREGRVMTRYSSFVPLPKPQPPGWDEMLTAEKARREPPHPMLCFAHGGSPDCERSNREHGFACPKCNAGKETKP